VKVGEIYFIREQDRTDGQHSSYVKIGLVRGAEQDSQERLSQHQTGNPRDLILHHVVKTPSPYLVEGGLHYRLGRKRIRGEWFILDDSELNDSISLAEQLAQEAFKCVSLNEKADLLGKTVSTGEILPFTQESHDWFERLNQSHARVNACKDLSKIYGDIFKSLDKKTKDVIESEGLIQTQEINYQTFDKVGFAQAYPSIFEQYISIEREVVGSFRTKYVNYSITELDRDLSQFHTDFRAACNEVADGTRPFYELAEIHRDLESRLNAYEWEKKIADVNLRVLCGLADGIDGLCTWKRSVKEKETLDEEGLQSDHPNEYQKFLTIEARTRQKTKKRPRRKISS
jgi:hypothetical protein